jgi:hypothetical protein
MLKLLIETLDAFNYKGCAIICILLRNPDDGHRSDRSMPVKHTVLVCISLFVT